MIVYCLKKVNLLNSAQWPHLMKQVSPDMEKRLRMAFNIYDVDGDGKISRDDLFNALKLMVRGGLKEKSLMEAVNRTWIRMAQKGEEDLMDFKEVGNLHRGCIFDREIGNLHDNFS